MLLDTEKLFFGYDGTQYMLLVDLQNGTAIAARAADIGGGGSSVPTYLVEFPPQ